MPIKDRIAIRKALKDLSHEVEKLTGIQIEKLNNKEIHLLNILAAVVGVVAGYAAIFLKSSIGFFQNLFLQNQVSFQPIAFNDHILGYSIFFLPPIIFVVVAAFVRTCAPETAGSGVTDVLESVLTKSGFIRARVVVVKAIASALTIASGGSSGQEGPIVHMGAATGSVFGRAIRLPTKGVKILLACGAAGGLAASFNTPIAAVIFAVEIILRELKTKSFVPLVIASVFATIVSRSYFGNSVEFFLPGYKMVSAVEIFFYLGLGLSAGLFGVLLNKVYYDISDKVQDWQIHYLWKALFGGLFISSVAFFYPQTLGIGYETMTEVLRGNGELKMIVALLLLKPLTMTITLAAGTSGGIFAPILFTGSMLGATYGIAMNYYFPNLSASFGAYALVGMAALFAACSRATFTAIVILFEMTMEYSIILPLMFTCVIADQIANLLSKHSIFSEKLRRKDINYHQEIGPDALRDLSIANLMTEKVVSFSDEMHLKDIEKLLKDSPHTLYPVLDTSKKVVGAISKPHFFKSYNTYKKTATAKDIMSELPTWVYPEDSLIDALQVLRRTKVSRVIVIAKNSQQLRGVLSGKDLLQLAQKIDK